jgi:lipopolysaccharide export system permease protein
VVQEKLALNMAWWPMHLAALTVVVLMFSWRVKVNSGLHPLVLWSKLKCRLLNGMRSKEKSCS